MATALPPRPGDATLSVTKAARLLGVHPNTVRAWSDAGRLRYYRINPRGDRRYRLADLNRFLSAAEGREPGVPGGTAADPWIRGVVGSRSRRRSAVTARASLGAHAIGRDAHDTTTARSRAERQERLEMRLRRAEALLRIATDIGGRLELDRVLAEVVDHALVLFAADRVAIFLRGSAAHRPRDATRGLSSAYVEAIRALPTGSLQAAAMSARRPVAAADLRDDPRAADVRSVIVQEGFESACSAPLLDGANVIGTLDIHHDLRHDWAPDELEALAALARAATAAIVTARDYEQMATWAAQLQSIQQLGARLNGLSSVHEIGLAIATELRQLIDYHNVRVYRLHGAELVPVAMAGQVGEYVDETPEQLRVALGEGITGWVALHRTAQYLPDAAADPRADTIPGTEDELAESMLLAPMVFEDQVLGVLVLSKLGLDQFRDDDLRLLVIYGSLAAQAMANADATERLREQSAAHERQVRSQRALLQITESMLTTLDARAVLESITDRLGGLIACDNIAIEVVDPATGLLTPLTARGIHAAEYLQPWEVGETGLATWVVEHNEPVYVPDERTDPRVNQFSGMEGMDGALMVFPLRGRQGAIGVLTLERLGAGASFEADEFELVRLFAAQVSIALHNAEVFRAVEVRARTDDLTGLYNHGTFEERLQHHVAEGSVFSLVMVDLDDFREVNNTLGHQAGDAFLRACADALRSAGRDSDLLFRYGGDEFLLLLPQTDQAGAHRVAERVRAAVARVGGPGSDWAAAGGVTASIGVATFPLDGETAGSVLLAADRACYVAKRTGRDRVATAEEGLALAGEFSLTAPTPVDPPTPAPA